VSSLDVAVEGDNVARRPAAPDAEVVLDGVFEQHYARLVRNLTVLGGDRDAAADAVQEAFVQAHLRWGQVGRYDDPVGWIRRVAINRLRTAHRGRVRGLRALRGVEAAVEAEQARGTGADDRVDLTAALERLPVRQRTAVVLFYLEGLSVAETAATMEVTSGSVKTHLSRAREAMRPLLEVR
jgi:RNA polymerase sigma-70 factor, ECF subfamily